MTNERKYELNRRLAGYEGIVRQVENCSCLNDNVVESVRQTRELDSSQEYVIADFRHNAIIFQD